MAKENTQKNPDQNADDKEVQLSDSDTQILSTLAWDMQKPDREKQEIANAVLKKFGVYLTDQETVRFLNDVRMGQRRSTQDVVVKYKEEQTRAWEKQNGGR